MIMQNAFESVRPSQEPQLSEAERREIRKRQLRTRLLQQPDSDRPEDIDPTLRELQGFSTESLDAADRLGHRALWAMLADEAKLRNVFLRRLKGMPKEWDETPSTDTFDGIYRAYRDVLHHASEAPAELADHIGNNALLKRIADLEAHRHLYLKRSAADVETFEDAYKHLWQAYVTAGGTGKEAEIALVGLVRYGPKAFAGAKKDQMITMDAFNPVVEFTLPREDVLGGTSLKRFVAETAKRDVVIYVPEPTPDLVTFDLGTGGQFRQNEDARGWQGKVKTGAAGLQMSANQLRTLWEAIGSPSRKDMPTGDEYRTWRDAYKDAVRDILGRTPQQHRAVLENILLPRVTRFQDRQARPKNYDKAQLKYDELFTLGAIRLAWPRAINALPELVERVGAEITLSNWELAKREFINLHRTDPTHPVFELFSLKSKRSPSQKTG